jgi:4'-phosphopantetheinyl transferase
MFKLDVDEIHVWPIANEASADTIERLALLLSEDELERAYRFHFEHLRTAFIVRRGARRILLGKYIGLEPERLQFVEAQNGKASLATTVHFNASRTDGLSVFAIGRNCELGVDVERIRHLPDKHDIAKRFFCPEEAAELARLPEELQEQAFFYCWTRKEAYLKATGEGLSAPLDQFRVTLSQRDPARFIHILHDPALTQRWRLHDLDVSAGYVAALAYQCSDRSVTVKPVTSGAELLLQE